MAPPKTQRPSRSKKAQSLPFTAAGILSEAERLKQQAERKPEGQAREPLLAQCAKLLEQALGSPLSPRQEEEALFDLGGVYALWGSSVQAGMYQTLGSIFSGNLHKDNALNIQSDAMGQSADLYRKSHEIYEKVASGNSAVLKQEALINSGNSLCDWAELLLVLSADRGGSAVAASDLFGKADLRYSTALSVSPDDVELLTNSGDCNVKRAELELLIGSDTPQSQAWTTAKAFYTKAMSAYGHACSLADARVGDDLAGLLQNWGASLLSLAERTPDASEAMVAHEQALEKLRTAAKFHPMDVSIFIAIGEACCAWAEQLGRMQALDLLVLAIEEGFGTALKINATCLDAMIGEAEAHLEAGKSASSIERQFVAEEHFIQSLNSYTRALQILKADMKNDCKLKFEEQCNMLFNLACVAAICNQESVSAEVLILLVQVGGISISDLAEDPDLQSLRTKDWFLALLQKDG